MFKRLWLLLFFSLSLYGITPINIVEVGEKKSGTYDGYFKFAFGSASGNNEYERYSVGSKFNLYFKKNAWLFNGSYSIQQSQGIRTRNNSFVHIRNIWEIYRKKQGIGIDWEYFGQVETDEFRELNFRGLVGTGLRFKPIYDYKIYFGIGPMWVKETYLSHKEEDNEVWRANIYFNIRFDVADKSAVSYVAYYQPEIEDGSNVDLKQSFEFESKITKSLSFVVNMSYDYDSNPISKVKKYDFSQTTSFKYNF